ncbi:MAG: DUF2059 domain-containing protein [Sphingomonas sp.]|uniref:DUF2059 domain-containing protein n=1 Tax=Sphingomonas sp. TaxID=28214 RepID=UPI0025F0AE27|nr:DUF2059 domain-containing protein [Sphingomonas sp.]MBX3565950.1 DUF2059 domain-containing protein [Sphingomonas sp.]
MILLYALALLAPDPTPEALALGTRLAESGTLAALLPMKIAQETEELVAEHPDWSDADKAGLRAAAAEQGKAGVERLMTATGRAYAEKLSIEDLRVLVAFNESEAGKRWRAATPGVIAAAMTEVGALDFKGDTRKAFCARAGKGCAQ